LRFSKKPSPGRVKQKIINFESTFYDCFGVE